MHQNRLLRLINRAQRDLDEARKEVEIEPPTEPDTLSEDLMEVRLRLDALEVRVSAIEEGHH